MKKKYEKPIVEQIEFQVTEVLMNGDETVIGGPELGVSQGVVDEW